MNHLDDATLVTVRDRGLVDGDAREHLDACAVCQEALEDARERAARIREAVHDLDAARVDVEGAKAEVRARLDARRDRQHRSSSSLLPLLGRAAALLLFVSGAVYALPNSPLRGWLEGGGEDAPAPAEVTSPVAEAEGIEVAIPTSGLSVALSLSAPTTVEVRWSDGDRLQIEAASGTRYRVSQDRVDAEAAPGAIRIIAPRTGPPVTVLADGRMILERVDGAVSAPGTVMDQDADRIVFSVGR